jgi:glyoxylase-like metal-dependent hydrolase (beta-lactamase superfamily II)
MAEETIERQRPINSPLKSKRFKIMEPENPIRWSFAKILREHDKTKKGYPVNPYAEVYQFRDNLYGIYTESLGSGGDPWMYLLLGPEKAMLVDTAFGVGNLKGLCDEISGGKPLIVVNTHAHRDHALGNFWFDKVYCHEYEVPALKSQMNPNNWEQFFDKDGNCLYTEFDRADIVPYKEYEVAGVPNGYVFNLGDDYDIELMHLPGHSVGHCAFLDKKGRILFVGDDACHGHVGIGGTVPGTLYGEYGTVEALRNELVKIVKRRYEFDGMFPGHGPVDLGSIFLVNVLEACEDVLKDPGHYDAKMQLTRNGVTRTNYGRMIYGSGYIRYNADSVYMNRAAQIE